MNYLDQTTTEIYKTINFYIVVVHSKTTAWSSIQKKYYDVSI